MEKSWQDILDTDQVSISVIENKSSNNVGKKQRDQKLDEQSRMGRFGWYEFERCFIPYIFRSEQKEKYVSIRMMETKLLNKFTDVLSQEMNNFAVSGLKHKGEYQTFCITESESRLLNEINHKHSDGSFGNTTYSTRDFVVKLSDAKEFYYFLQMCYKKSILKTSSQLDRCGFFRIDSKRIVPFTKWQGKATKYIPLFYFQGGCDYLNVTQVTNMDGWDAAYLKFCCFVQGVKSKFLAEDSFQVAKFEDLRSHFPEHTLFEEYWPGTKIDKTVDTENTKPISNEKVLEVLDQVLNMGKENGSSEENDE